MERIFIENDNARITLRNDMLLNVEMYSGEKFEGVEAHRLFPVTGVNKYISLLDSNGKEVAVIRDVRTLMTESREAVEKALWQYYIIPKIRKITSISWKNGTLRASAITNYGDCSFEVRSRPHNIKTLPDGRVLIRDINDNRYEIPDISKLDRKSLDILLL